MSALNELIHRLCPEGVEYKKLGEVLDYEQPTKYIVESTEYDNSYDIPVLTAGQTFILGHTNEKFGIYKASLEIPTIIFDDFTTSFHWVDFDFKVKSSAMKMLRPKETFNGSFKYVYYAMKCIRYEAVDHSRHWISKYSQFEIPLPPLPVQAELVRILDRFTDLAAELQAELQARREQYEYYRNRLLSFEEAEVKWMKMSEVCEFFNGFAFKSNLFKQDGKKIIRITNIAEARLDLTDVKFFIPEDYKINLEQYEIKNGDILIAMSGATTGKIGYYEGDEILYMNQRVGKIAPIKSILNNRFLFHFLLSKTKYIYQLAGGGAQPNLSSTKFLNTLIIPLPTKEEQIKIATILDRFEALTADLSQGLPAEIAAVQEQYEYYRNRLLSFPAKKRSA